MILKTLTIQNFRSYYGCQNFRFSEGLTLIIGGNGDGKTTFFEALHWLLDTTKTKYGDPQQVSAKRFAELQPGETDTVSVSMTFDHNGAMELCKSFSFTKTENGNMSVNDGKFIGYEEQGSERNLRNGASLLDSCFEPIIRKYCMFKGESELNVFDSKDALKILVNTFSSVQQFDSLLEPVKYCADTAEKAFRDEVKKDRTVAEKAKEIDIKISRISNEIQSLRAEKGINEQNLAKCSKEISSLENTQNETENYQQIKNRISKKTEDARKLKAAIEIDYNSYLLDRYWILCAFPQVLSDFQNKIAKICKEKRKLEREDTERRAKEKGKQEALEEIGKMANGLTPLPWNLPDKQTMQEMIEDECCKVCGRPAPKGTDAYDFMVHKLNEYLRHCEDEAKKQAQTIQSQPLFINNFIDELQNRRLRMSGDVEAEVSSYRSVIEADLQFVESRKEELRKVSEELEAAKHERDKFLAQTNTSEDTFEKNFYDIKGLFLHQADAVRRVDEIEKELANKEIEKQQLWQCYCDLNGTNFNVQLRQKVSNTLKIIMVAVENAKKRNVRDFLINLEEQANEYFRKLNEKDFSGIVRIIPQVNDTTARIELQSENGDVINNPGGAQKTTMYMSVLFAISNITCLKREHDYPLVFDAPTSSFEDYKEDVFYNVIDKIDKQCIIVTKDLLLFSENAGEEKVLNLKKINQLTCSVYRICKSEGYNPLDLSTIQTNVIFIK